jgi:hypothetical protein
LLVQATRFGDSVSPRVVVEGFVRVVGEEDDSIPRAGRIEHVRRGVAPVFPARFLVEGEQPKQAERAHQRNQRSRKQRRAKADETASAGEKEEGEANDEVAGSPGRHSARRGHRHGYRRGVQRP